MPDKQIAVFYKNIVLLVEAVVIFIVTGNEK